MRRSQGSLLLSIFFLLGASAAAAAPRLVKDLNRGPATELFPSGAIAVSSFGGRTLSDRGILYFSAPDPAHGTELWRSNGTAAGTYRLTDVCPGRCDALPQSLAVFQGRIYFSADDGFMGREVWSSDGTPGNERRLRDLCPGPCSFEPGGFQSVGGTLFFVNRQGQTQRLWRSDGTRAGTTLVTALCALPYPSAPDCASSLQRLGNRLLFVVNGTEGSELWSSDGTPGTSGETVFLSGLTVGGEPRLLGGAVVHGGIALFLTDDALWRTDGTPAGTVELAAIDALVPGAGAPSGAFAVFWKGAFYFFFNGNAVRSDGTPQGTVRFDFPQLLVENLPVPLSERLVLHASHVNLDTLWAMDSAGHVAQIFAIDSAHPAFLTAPVPVGNRAVFQTQSAARPVPEVWVTDGTAAGTHRIGSGGSVASELFSTGNAAFYLAGTFDRAAQLWRTDGTPAGTLRVRDFAAGPGSSGPLAQAALGNSLVFSAQVSAQISAGTAPLFRSNGTAAGTALLSNEAAFADGFARVGSRLFFGAHPDDLWWTDGTGGGTARVAAEIGDYKPLIVRGQKLFFAGGDGSGLPFFGSDVELWSSDGTSTGRVKDINPFQRDSGFHGICVNASSSPGPGALLSSGLFVFPADDGVHGRELWASDGTASGTRLVADLNPQTSPTSPSNGCDSRTTTGLPSNPGGFVAFRQGALFTADDGTAGRELWLTDGAGARRVRDLRPGAQGAAPHDLTVFRGLVYFIASAQGLGEALWRTDGTAAGTVLVDDLRIGALPSWGRSLTVAGDQLFFVVTSEATGPELWVSRGQASSTGMVADLRPGPPGSSPQELTAVGKVLLFAATDGKRGMEPWRSDGTAAGTVRLGDLNPGRDASSPGPFTRAGNFVFTGAYDPVHGRELWAIPVAEVAP